MDLGFSVRVPWVPEKFQEMAQSFRPLEEPHPGETLRVSGPRLQLAFHPEKQPEQTHEDPPQPVLSQMLSLQVAIYQDQAHASLPESSPSGRRKRQDDLH